jgi:menaquinone-dependent protoporphyrinogen oxidase
MRRSTDEAGHAATETAAMPRALVIYASTHGHTAKIAARIGAALEQDGATVDLHDVRAGKPQPTPLDYDAVVVGASIHAGHHQRELVEWAERHRSGLATIPSAFFSVCLTAADDTEESRTATRGYLDDFVERTGWTPVRRATFAGALQYREYDFATRLLMRLLMRHMHHDTDASRDHDYTDWEAVDRWAHDFSAAFPAATARFVAEGTRTAATAVPASSG